jgi:hypothetical protein
MWTIVLLSAVLLCVALVGVFALALCRAAARETPAPPVARRVFDSRRSAA